MQRLAYRDHLDALVACGCGDPGCAHPHGERVFLTSLCHQGRGVRVTICDDEDGLLHVSCWHCQRLALDIAIETPAIVVWTCWHKQALDVEYREGLLQVTCRRCHAPAGTLTVLAEEETWDA